MKITLWDILAVVLIIATVVVGLFMLNIYNDPGSLSFLRTPTLPALVAIPTNTNTPFSMPPTWTPTQGSQSTLAPSQTLPPTATGFVMATYTPRPTLTFTPSMTPTVTITRTPTVTPTVNSQATLDSLRATVWAEQTITAAAQQTATAQASITPNP